MIVVLFLKKQGFKILEADRLSPVSFSKAL